MKARSFLSLQCNNKTLVGLLNSRHLLCSPFVYKNLNMDHFYHHPLDISLIEGNVFFHLLLHATINKIPFSVTFMSHPTCVVSVRYQRVSDTRTRQI
ncbi:hypothetical protein QL285_031910 [Trifolium repens]|nr:hypothetical protein QL285_031910 [Trifolium repens]